MLDSVAKNHEDDQVPGRAKRELDLYALWNTNTGQRQVLNHFWKLRTSRVPLQAGDSVIQLILEYEFGSPG